MKLTHLDEEGQARMVDVSEKQLIKRMAVAEGKLFFSELTYEIVRSGGLPKGGPIETARLAGIQAAKRTNHLIPLCHDLNLDWVDVQIEVQRDGFMIHSQVHCRWATGVEMEALVAVSVAALTLYDMCKAVDKDMVIGAIQLVKKIKGG